LHIKFMFAEDIFESRTIQKQGENNKYMFESRTTQMQEGENDEDITNIDTPIVVAYDSKVKLFFSIIIFNICDEWMLHHDMCSVSFTEVLTWIKEGVDHAWKGWIMKHPDWGPNTSTPYFPTRSPRYLWYKETKRPSLIRFGKADSDSRIVHTKIITEVTYGLCFERSLYGWKVKKIAFPMDLVSSQNTFLFHGKRQNNEAYKICQGVVLPYFGQMGYVSN
jgi:hypothetical protein